MLTHNTIDLSLQTFIVTQLIRKGKENGAVILSPSDIKSPLGNIKTKIPLQYYTLGHTVPGDVVFQKHTKHSKPSANKNQKSALQQAVAFAPEHILIKKDSIHDQVKHSISSTSKKSSFTTPSLLISKEHKHQYFNHFHTICHKHYPGFLSRLSNLSGTDINITTLALMGITITDYPMATSLYEKYLIDKGEDYAFRFLHRSIKHIILDELSNILSMGIVDTSAKSALNKYLSDTPLNQAIDTFFKGTVATVFYNERSIINFYQNASQIKSPPSKHIIKALKDDDRACFIAITYKAFSKAMEHRDTSNTFIYDHYVDKVPFILNIDKQEVIRLLSANISWFKYTRASLRESLAST